jgi:pyruvate formate lyase activating enzyme
MNIGGLLKNSMIDYPGKLSCGIFLSGCNFDCPYCHNPDLIPKAGQQVMNEVDMEELLAFLEQRRGKLDGVVIGGGEPTLQEGLFCFIRRLRRLGFAIKLDTNGSRPDVLEIVLKEGLADYIAMDIKAPP